ncbi:MFS transporter [Rhodococcus opacus]|uniref:MFS transporter n=1 Tax=Rhodococcus opacus TaxID=37919 RepID=UPI00280AE421|nr:MFS transporter [Rhodococcus opacus]
MQDHTILTAGDRSGNETEATDSPRLPVVVYILALGTFLMLTTEFVVAGILPEIAADLQISLAQAGSLITVFAIGMVVGAPVMTMLTSRLSTRLADPRAALPRASDPRSCTPLACESCVYRHETTAVLTKQGFSSPKPLQLLAALSLVAGPA